MPDPTPDIEDRLRAHLARVATSAPPEGLERRILTEVDRPRAASWQASFAIALVVIAAVTILVMTVAGQQVNNVFSNISNGLNQ